MWDAILDSLIDTVKLIPFLLITYIIMEFIEHKTSHKTKDAIKKSGHFGPLIGGIQVLYLNVAFPQQLLAYIQPELLL